MLQPLQIEISFEMSFAKLKPPKDFIEFWQRKGYTSRELFVAFQATIEGLCSNKLYQPARLKSIKPETARKRVVDICKYASAVLRNNRMAASKMTPEQALEAWGQRESMEEFVSGQAAIVEPDRYAGSEEI
jgi:hypothetical protein